MANDKTKKAKIKKRFIAGAICPRCKALDKLMMYKVETSDIRECVECGFQDKMHFKPVIREMDTRVNLSEEQIEEETQIVRLIIDKSK